MLTGWKTRDIGPGLLSALDVVAQPAHRDDQPFGRQGPQGMVSCLMAHPVFLGEREDARHAAGQLPLLDLLPQDRRNLLPERYGQVSVNHLITLASSGLPMA